MTDSGHNWDFITGGSCHKYHSCRDKSMLASTNIVTKNTCLSRKSILLSRQKTCLKGDKTFVATNVLLSFVATNVLLSFVATNIPAFVATKDVFCRDRHVFVTTKPLSRQK